MVDETNKTVLIKDHLSHEDTFVEVFSYGTHKLHERWYKTLLFGLMAGFFIGVTYIIVIIALSGFIVKDENEKLTSISLPSGIIALITGLTFTPAILMIIFIGGSLFTSNSLTLLPVIKRQEKLYKMINNLSIVLLGNFIGALIVAISTYLMGHLRENSDFYNVFKYIFDKKIGDITHFDGRVFLKNFISGIYCNILIAGLFWMSMAVKSSASKILLCFFVILAFGISGFQHIVANAYIWMTGLFVNHNASVGKLFGVFFLSNMIPTLLGNFIGGSIVLPVVYLIVFNNRINREIKKGTFKNIK